MTNHQINMQDAELYQRLFVKPMVDAVETKLETMLAPVLADRKQLRNDLDAVAARTAKLESSQKKALAGWGVFATAIAGAMSYSWSWIKSHFHIS